MIWEIFERSLDEGGVKEWALFIALKGTEPAKGASPFARGWWFFEKDTAGDPYGKRAYEDGLRAAQCEVDRLNRLGRPPPPAHSLRNSKPIFPATHWGINGVARYH